MEALVIIFGGFILLSIILSLDTSNKESKFQRKIKGKNISMPDWNLMFGGTKKKRR